MNAQAEAVSSRVDVIKLVTVGAPLFATSLAIFYDVGFFYAIDAGFFTFFSLTEHLVFALQALPFALVPAVWVLSMAAMVYFGDRLILKKRQEVLQQALNMSPQQLSAMSERAGKRVSLLYWVAPAIIIAALAWSAYLFWIGSYAFALAGIVGTFWVFLFDLPLNSMSSERRILSGVVSVSVIWALSFAIGYELGEGVGSSTPREIITIGSDDFPSRLVRVGERGVLLVATNEKKTR